MAYEFEHESEALPEFEDELGELAGEVGGEGEDEAGMEGEGWLGAIGKIAGSLLGEQESEEESESEDESEISPIRKIYPDAMMEHLGELAAEADTEAEAAEHFLPLIGMAASKLLPVVARSVAPLAKRALPHVARTVTRATPHLTKGIGQVARTLHRNPQTRHLLRTIPSIARRTVGNIAHQAARGRHITPRAAMHTLARQTRRVLASPARRTHVLRRHQNLERRFHRGWGRGMARPHWQVDRRYAHGVRPGYTGMTTGPRRRIAGSAYTPVGGAQCSCGPCPSCGYASRPGVMSNPAYCRCCGQVLR
jgi:hypothetical protein